MRVSAGAIAARLRAAVPFVLRGVLGHSVGMKPGTRSARLVRRWKDLDVRLMKGASDEGVRII